jgi:hypothetical protein
MKRGMVVAICACLFVVATNGIEPTCTIMGHSSHIDAVQPSTDANHAVLVEYGSQTTCVECPLTSNQLYDLYAAEAYGFFYVSLVADENEAAHNRLQALGATTYPAVYVDGGDRRVMGAQHDAGAYIDAIVSCSSRNVHPVEVYLETKWTSSPCFPLIRIYVDIVNQGTSVYEGHLLISIIEIKSEWKDYSGRPFSYALLDYVCNDNITIAPAPLGAHSAVFTWFPNTTHCGTAHDPNMLVMVTVFSESNGFADETVVSRLADGSPPNTPATPLGTTNGKIGEAYTYSTCSTDPDDDKIKYGWDWNGDYHPDEWTDYITSGQAITVTHRWETKGHYNVQVIAVDETGMEGFWSKSLLVSMPLDHQTPCLWGIFLEWIISTVHTRCVQGLQF